MYISKFQVTNYKSILKSPELEFTPGFNIISGQNNSGKTALLEALSLRFLGIPHRSLKTVQSRDMVPAQGSSSLISFEVSGPELKELLLATPNSPYRIVQPAPNSPEAHELQYTGDDNPSVNAMVATIFSKRRLTFTLRLEKYANIGNDYWTVPNPSTFDSYPVEVTPNGVLYLQFALNPNGEIKPMGVTYDQNRNDIGLQITATLQRHIYRFSAERMKVGRGPHGANTHLNQDASNLPEVLAQLAQNPFHAGNKPRST